MSETANEFHKEYEELQEIMTECNHLKHEIHQHHLNETSFEAAVSSIEKHLEIIREHIQKAAETEEEKKKQALENITRTTEIINEILGHHHFHEMLHYEAEELEEKEEAYLEELRERAKHLIEEIEHINREAEEAKKHFAPHPSHACKAPFGNHDD